MSYVFSHQKILDLKEKEREQAQYDYGSALHLLKLEEEGLEMLILERERVSSILEGNGNKIISVAHIMDIQNYLSHLDDLIKKKTDTKAQAVYDAELALGNLTGKRREEKIWTALKDKTILRYHKKQEKSEQKQMDEIATAAFFRNHPEKH